MRNVNFPLTTFLVGVMMMLVSFEGYSQSILQSTAKKKEGGGTGNCYTCTMAVSYDITFTILPAHFPFKVEQMTFSDINTNGFNIQFGGAPTYSTSQFQIINPYTNTTVPNHVIQANSPFLTPKGLLVTVRVIPGFCADPSVNPSLFNGYKMNAEVQLTNIGQGVGNSDVSETLSDIIPLEDACGISLKAPNPLGPFVFSTAQSSLQSGKLFEAGENGVVSKQINIFPNPFEDEVEVQLVLDEEQTLDIKVFNQMGQEIAINGFSNSFPKGETFSIINLEKYPAGIYYIYVNSVSGNQVFKVLKTKN